MHLSTKTALLLIAVVLVLYFVPLPETGRISNAIQDLAHVPVGILLAVTVWDQLRHRLAIGAGPAALIAFVVVSVVLAAIEGIQPLLGRGRSMQDFGTGVLAAAGALAIALARGHVGLSRIGAWILGLALIGVAAWPGGRILGDAVRQWRDLPLLASFEDDLELTRWSFHGADGARSSEHATHETSSLRVEYQSGLYPAVTLVDPCRDWRGRTGIAFDAWLEGGSSFDLVLKIVDAEHDGSYEDRFHHYFTLQPGENQVRVPMDDIVNGLKTRRLDLARIRRVQLFVEGFKERRTVYLDHVRLTGRGR